MMAAADALVGEALSISPWKEALAELEIAKLRIRELEAKLQHVREKSDGLEAEVEYLQHLIEVHVATQPVYKGTK
jgi:predicted  nucleic acid-binding Zn-ribbon protein